MDREEIIEEINENWGNQYELISYLEDCLWNSGLHGEDHDDQVTDAHAIGFIVGRHYEATPEAMADAFLKRFSPAEEDEDEESFEDGDKGEE